MNRYGRHGTRAWLRRHLRRRETQQTSTSLVVAKSFIPNIVLNITVPAGVERVIIIMVGNLDDYDETNGQDNIIPLPSPIVNADPDSQGVQTVKQGAKICVKTFLDKINGQCEGASIYIDRKKLDEIILNFLRKERDNFPRHVKFDIDNFDGIFEKEFRRLLEDYQALHPQLFLTQKEWDICSTAQTDRENAPPDHTRVGQYHDRDLAVLNAVKYFEINYEEVTNREHLKKVHDFADAYEAFYRGERKGVMWVDDLGYFLGSFR